MAVNKPIIENLPDGCYRQPTESEGIDAQGLKTNTVITKGPYDRVKTLLEGLSKGCHAVSGWDLSSANLTRANGAGILTLVCYPHVEDTDADGTAHPKELSETWTLKTVRNDKSILAYCGSGLDNPVRALVEAWMKEPDGKIAAGMGFRDSGGDEVYIPNLIPKDGPEQENGESGDPTYKASNFTSGQINATCELITKIRNGIDSVMRFYPMLTKTTIFSDAPKAVYEHVSEIDTPVVSMASGTVLKAPGNLADIIHDHTWVKCQDDYSQTSDGKHMRTESWLGGDDGVDVNLYGKKEVGGSRWEMPYEHDKHGGH